MVKKKAKSKRVTLHQKYKVLKKVKEHHRQIRKETRKNPLYGQKRVKKDPGIPNLWPLKEEFMQKLQNQKAKMEEEKEHQKSVRSKEQQQKKRSLESVVTEANKKNKDFEQKQKGKQEEEKRSSIFDVKEGSKRAYFREFKKILEVADVILEVLDARDPLGSRCPEIEQKILKKDPNKKIILILNKIDLVPRDNVEQWLKYLRSEYPTIAFKCTTQEQKRHLTQSSISTDLASKNLLNSSECLGADLLIQLLKNYSRNSNMKTAISVGIIGYPNVGKSSLINSLKRSKAVGVGATPGFTKTTQEIHLDKNVRLIDCPGIVFSSSVTDNDIILRNAVKIEKIPDPTEPVEIILKRCKAEQLMSIYQIPKFSTINEFLLHIALKKGKLGKGGVPDIKGSAKAILRDWNSGRIPFYTIPPERKNVHVSAEIVSAWGKQFDIDSVVLQETSMLSHLPDMDSSKLMALAPGTSTVDSELLDDTQMNEEFENENDLGEDEDPEQEDDVGGMEEETWSVATETPNIADLERLKSKKSAKQAIVEEEDEHNPQFNKNRKKEQKKLRKQKKKDVSRLMQDDDEEAPVLPTKTSTTKAKAQESYNFATDYYDKNGTFDDDIDLDDV